MLFSGFFLKRDLYKIYKLYNLTMIQDAYTCWCRLSFWAGDEFAESDTWITLCHLQSVVCAHVRTCACVWVAWWVGACVVGECICASLPSCHISFLLLFWQTIFTVTYQVPCFTVPVSSICNFCSDLNFLLGNSKIFKLMLTDYLWVLRLLKFLVIYIQKQLFLKI